MLMNVGVERKRYSGLFTNDGPLVTFACLASVFAYCISRKFSPIVARACISVSCLPLRCPPVTRMRGVSHICCRRVRDDPQVLVIGPGVPLKSGILL